MKVTNFAGVVLCSAFFNLNKILRRHGYYRL